MVWVKLLAGLYVNSGRAIDTAGDKVNVREGNGITVNASNQLEVLAVNASNQLEA